MSAIEISLHVMELPSLGSTFCRFLDAELPNLLEDIPLVFHINDWFQHDGAPPQRNF
jgi:hypothetical protein